MSSKDLIVHDARQNNLKGITVRIPHRSLTVVTGPSGSGKSSLAFDTIYAEGQRRYVESLSTYAKQFLERIAKPNVGRLDGISPSVAIEQKNPTTSSRSTVGTATEVHDYLRLLWARAGKPYCRVCDSPVHADSPGSATRQIIEQMGGESVTVVFEPPASSHEVRLETLNSLGFVRVMIGETVHHLADLPEKVSLDHPQLVVVVDRIRVSQSSRNRLVDSLSTAFAEGGGSAEVRGERTLKFSQTLRCTNCNIPGVRLSPSLFSFNNPHGACEVCNGFGAVLEYDESLIVPDRERSLEQGAIDPWTKPRYTGRRTLLRSTAQKHEIGLDTPWRKLKQADRDLLLQGKSGRFLGVMRFLKDLERKRYKQYIRVFLRQYQMALTCPGCAGARLNADALAVRVGNTNIAEVSNMTPPQVLEWIDNLVLDEFHTSIARPILNELRARTSFLDEVGLGYLTFDRQTRTLSGGEAQRISLSNALGANLMDTLYVLDEPTIGLHPRDTARLISLLEKLRDAGNTVLVVEHDMDTIRKADWIVELGPKSGEHGGNLVYAGPVESMGSDTATGAYLSGKRTIPAPAIRRRPGSRTIALKGATLHNIKNLDVEFPLNCLIMVTGVSGSGKSTLVHDILYRQLARHLKGTHGAKQHLGEQIGTVSSLTGWKYLDDVVLVDQSPIGKSPRSNPITYVKGFDDVRNLFARQPLSQARGYTPTTFSFNAIGGGRCAGCDGAGHIVVEMLFMADVFVACEACDGTRYEKEVREVKIAGLSIADVLNLTVDEAILRFKHQDKLGRALWHLQQVGLGYLKLGQPATTLSGGEAQRLKIARQLATVSKGGKRLYILDEPTTGLHSSDVFVLAKVLDRLVDAGHTVIVIEHNLDLIKRADWIIDMGPEGGPGGGKVIIAGTPDQVAASDSHTGRFLKMTMDAD